ncbi:MAG: ATP-binding protein [Gudongella sp.]|nr:ATP-binding protein [Gudongella sp.]
MLVNYKFKNFRSFCDETELGMVASSQRTFNENLIRKNNLRILPSVVIYGANASGKSNIIMSLEVLQEIVLSGSLVAGSPILNNLELYPFIHQNEKQPMEFSIEFIHNGKHLLYSLGILVESLRKANREIVFESLELFDSKGKSIELFNRSNNKVKISRNKKALREMKFQEQLLDEFEKKLNQNLDVAELFLSRGFKNIISNELAEIILDFFKNKLIVVSDFSLRRAEISYFDKSTDKDDYLVWNDFLDGFVKNADFGPQKIAFLPKSKDNQSDKGTNLQLVSFYEKDSKLVAVPAVLMESRGTQKLLDFAIPFTDTFESGGVFVLDEFDSSIHPELIKGIIELFNNADINTNGAQLIFTTHNPIYLNNKMFRRDQIRFIEKEPQTYKSFIYSLADFGSEEVRNDHNYLINYFKGNYGALPFIDFSTILFGEEGHENENV